MCEIVQGKVIVQERCQLPRFPLPNGLRLSYEFRMKAASAWTGLLLVVLLQNARADGVDDLVEREMNRRKIPGMAIAVVQRGKEMKRAEYGLANVELKAPIVRDSAFEIGSITSQFTAAAILLLAQEGKLKLDDSITKHIKSAPASWKKITLRHLLSNTAGLKSYTMQPGFELTKHMTQEMFVEQIAALPPDFSPGDKASFSVSNHALLGFVVENVSGQNFWAFLADRIFSPLGMSSSSDREARLIIANRVSGYEKNKSGVLMNRDTDLTDMFSAGAMITTIDDLLKWDAALDSERILTGESKMQMWTPTKLNNGSASQNGFGCRIDTYKIYICLSHTGSTGGFNACYLKFPEAALSVVVLCNLGELAATSGVAKEIAGTYLDKE
jgi:D-alanyl-D-alanine carboxypeptidase